MSANLRMWGVRRVGVFGSFRHDAAREDSDVDLLVEFEPGQKTFDHFLALAAFLEGSLQRPVALVTPEALSPASRAAYPAGSRVRPPGLGRSKWPRWTMRRGKAIIWCY